MKILELKHVSKSYQSYNGTPIQALKSIDFHINQGERVGLVGESGSGKSSIAKIITQLTTLSGGELLVKGKRVPKLKARELKEYYKEIQMVFQNPLETFSPKMKIDQYMIQPYLNYKICDKEEALIRSIALLQSVGLDSTFLNKLPQELSGGELQRVVIARVIGMNPSIVIFDECTAALDVSIQKSIITLLKEKQAELQFSSLFISHDLAMAVDICDRIYVLYKGEIVEALDRCNFKQPQHPYSKKLFAVTNSLQRALKPQVHKKIVGFNN